MAVSVDQFRGQVVVASLFQCRGAGDGSLPIPVPGACDGSLSSPVPGARDGGLPSPVTMACGGGMCSNWAHHQCTPNDNQTYVCDNCAPESYR